MDHDVLICGLGPVGQLLAHLLGARGVRVLACDAAPAPYDLPRAAVIDDEVLRILQAAGLDADVLRSSQVQQGVSYVTAGGRAVDVFDTAAGPLGQPPLVSIHQPSLERALIDALPRRATVEARWGLRLEEIDQRADGVVAWVRPAEGGRATPVRARWLIGCDGAASTVRGLLGVAFGGSTFAQRWVVVDATVDRPLRRVPQPYFVGNPERPIVTLPMSPGRHRWEWMLHPGEDPAPLLDRDAIEQRMARWLDGERATVERAVVYTFHARIAARWRVGRVLLAGDAAHVTPPFAGQGFSSGARDVGNLAWKLAAVLDGAPARLLDSYEQERRPHVAAMQRLAIRWGGMVQTTDPRVARLRDRAMEALDGSALLEWTRRRVKPLPTCARGAFARRPRRLPFRRSVGALFPQPEVRTADGAVRRLDDALPDGWVALSREHAATAALSAAGLDVRRLGADLGDRSGALGAWLDARRCGWVLLRPDRVVFACGDVRDVAPAVVALRALLGPAAAGPARRAREAAA